MEYDNYNQSKSDVWKFILIVGCVLGFGIIMMVHVKAFGDEYMRINMDGQYNFDYMVVTDSYGNVFEPAWKAFDLEVPDDVSYILQIDVYSKQSFRTFSPTYTLGKYVRAADYETKLTPTHIRVVLFVGLLQAKAEFNFLERQVRSKLHGMYNERGEIDTVILVPELERDDGVEDTGHSRESSKASM